MLSNTFNQVVTAQTGLVRKEPKRSILEGIEQRCISEDLMKLHTAWNLVNGVVISGSMADVKVE